MTNNEAGRNVGGEYYAKREGVSVRSLLEDNRSQRAVEGRSRHQANKKAGRLILTVRCSDSRNMAMEPERELSIRSIDAAPDFDSFSPLLLDPGVMGVLIEDHFQGDDIEKGKSPTGCGGRGVKEKLLSGKQPQSDIEQWVHEHVAHSDILLDLFRRSHNALGYTNKDLLLAARDHLDQTIYPIMAFLKEPTTPPAVNMEEFDPKVVYKHGVPHLTSAQLKGSAFEDYFNDYYSKTFPMLHNFGLFDRTSQLTQNPKVLLLTTNVIPAEICYPSLSEKPGNVFVATIARSRDPKSGQVRLQENDIDCAIKQAHYPISHFSATSTVFIETEEIVQSERIVNHLKRKDWFQRWMEGAKNQVIVGQTNNGVLEIAKVFPK